MDHDFIKREEINTQNIVMSLRYLEPKRVIEDTRRLRMTFTNFHVSQFDATIGDHFESLLCMQGYLQITSESETQKITKALLSTRIIFPKSYPKKAPTIAIMNPNGRVKLMQTKCTPLIKFMCWATLQNTRKIRWTKSPIFLWRFRGWKPGHPKPTW